MSVRDRLARMFENRSEILRMEKQAEVKRLRQDRDDNRAAALRLRNEIRRLVPDPVGHYPVCWCPACRVQRLLADTAWLEEQQ